MLRCFLPKCFITTSVVEFDDKQSSVEVQTNVIEYKNNYTQTDFISTSSSSVQTIVCLKTQSTQTLSNDKISHEVNTDNDDISHSNNTNAKYVYLRDKRIKNVGFELFEEKDKVKYIKDPHTKEKIYIVQLKGIYKYGEPWTI